MLLLFFVVSTIDRQICGCNHRQRHFFIAAFSELIAFFIVVLVVVVAVVVVNEYKANNGWK